MKEEATTLLDLTVFLVPKLVWRDPNYRYLFSFILIDASNQREKLLLSGMASCFCTDDLLVCFPVRTDQNEILPLWDALRNILPKATGYLYRFWLSAFLTEGNSSHFSIWISLLLLKKYHRVIRSKGQRQVPMYKHRGGTYQKHKSMGRCTIPKGSAYSTCR